MDRAGREGRKEARARARAKFPDKSGRAAGFTVSITGVLFMASERGESEGERKLSNLREERRMSGCSRGFLRIERVV